MPRSLCPLRVNGDIVAVLALGPRSTAGDYTDGDQDFVRRHFANLSFLLSDERLAAKVGMEIARSRRTRWELESAREVQRRLLSCSLPGINGLTITVNLSRSVKSGAVSLKKLGRRRCYFQLAMSPVKACLRR